MRQVCPQYLFYTLAADTLVSPKPRRDCERVMVGRHAGRTSRAPWVHLGRDALRRLSAHASRINQSLLGKNLYHRTRCCAREANVTDVTRNVT